VSLSVASVTVAYNAAEMLPQQIEALLLQARPVQEIIVVDNASTDDSESVAQQHQVRWLKLATNVGLAPALNRGAEIAAGKFLLFVNNDMRFDEQFVAKLVEPLLRDETIFATDATQFFWDGTGPGHAASRLGKTPSGRALETELIRGLYFSQENVERETYVFMASAACMLARRSRDPDQTRRLLALAEIYDGGSRPDAARIGGVGVQIVRDWVVRFNAKGPDGLLTGKAPGAPSILDERQRQALRQVVEDGPIPALHGVVRWRLIDLAQWLFEEFRVSISKPTLSRELRHMGFRKLSARPRHHAQDEEAAAAFKKTFSPSWRRPPQKRLLASR